MLVRSATKSPTIREATREDIAAFSSLPNKPTIKAWVAERDGDILGIGGFALVNGRWFGFLDLKDEMRRHKFTIARAAKMVMGEARRQGIRYVYAEPDTEETNALRFLTSLGFQLDERSGFLRRWQHSRP